MCSSTCVHLSASPRPAAATSLPRSARTGTARWSVADWQEPRAALRSCIHSEAEPHYCCGAEGGLPTSVLESLTQVSDMPSSLYGQPYFTIHPSRQPFFAMH